MIITDEKILRKRNEDVEAEEIEELIQKLENSLASSSNGLGLAAPQIAINKRVCIVRMEKTSLDLINPVIVDKKHYFVYKGESCLSFPGINKNTQRFKEVFVKDDLHPAGLVATGLFAVVIQHEVDHLDGILIIDRISRGKIGRNDLCPCGKPIKYKKCHGR